MTEYHHPDLSLTQQFAATMDWWRDAGVDCLFEDEPHSLLTEPEAEAAPAPVRKVAPVAVEEDIAPSAPAINASDLPQTLSEFVQWWCDPASPLPQGLGPMVAPMGTAGARLMVIAPMPENGDGLELMTGPQGRMIRNMLKALAVEPADAYLAAALPSHMPMPDWDGLAQRGLGEVLAHHIALARPQRVLLLGSAIAKLLGEPADLPILANYAPEQLLAHPRQRALLWHRLLEWMPPV